MYAASARLLLGVTLLCAGCSLPERRADLDSPAPDERTRGLARVASTGDMRAVPQVVELLDSSDPAVRMFAIRTLERLTGETLGYDHAAPERERAEAVDRWVRWVEEGGGPTREARSPTMGPSSEEGRRSERSDEPSGARFR